MFPGGYIPDYGRPRARRTTAGPASTALHHPANAVGDTANPPSTGGVTSAAVLPNSSMAEYDGPTWASIGRVDTKFALAPALITCLVRHVDSQHNALATPAIVECCLRDLQRRLMPWVPVERVFGSTMRATVSAGASSTTTSAVASQGKITGDGAAPSTSTPHTGSYLAGSHVRLQLAKTTDNSVVVGIGASVLHLLFYAVDEPESRPSHLVHVVQEWQDALKTKGEEHDCMVLLVHSDLVAASEAAARMAEEAQKGGGGSGDEPQTEAVARQPRNTPSASLSLSPPASASTRPTAFQDKVDAAAAQLGKYYKELQDLKLASQQYSAYMPSETPIRILERLRPAVIARGARLRLALQIAVARKRQFPQDPSTKPIPLPETSLSLPTTVQASTASHASTTSSSSLPPSSPRPASSPQRAVAHAAARTSSALPQASPSISFSTSTNKQYFNVQALWRTGYDLVVHYLQYGLVFDARETLKHLYLEYYNNSDDYIFLRTPIATLERLGRVPNLFDAHGHAGWETGRTGYPKALEPGAELLEGLLLLAAAEMTCSLLLGDVTAALLRYNTFVQVTREKFEEWTVSEAKTKLPVVTATPLPRPLSKEIADADQNHQEQLQAIAVTSRVTSSTYQQFFLLQCYLSGLRMWWPTSGLCRPRKATSPSRATPARAATTAAAEDTENNTNKEKQEHATEAAPLQRTPNAATTTFSPLRLSPLKMDSLLDTGDRTALSAPKVDPQEDSSVAVALCTSPLLLPTSGNPAAEEGPTALLSSPTFPTTYVTSTDFPPRTGEEPSGAVSAPPAILESNSVMLSDTVNNGPSSGARYSMTNPSFATSGGSPISSLFPRGSKSFAKCSAAPPYDPAAAPIHSSGRVVSVESHKSNNDNEVNSTEHQLPLAGEGEDDVIDDDDDDDLSRFELNYLMAGSEDTVQASAGYLMELSISIGLVAPSMEPEELSGTAEAIRDAMESANAELVQELQQRQRQLRRNCAEVASLLERARDSLAAVAHDLGYSLFRRSNKAASSGDSQNNKGRVEDEERAQPLSPPAVTTSTAFSNIEELSSPAQVLRLWRILAAMAALTLRISDQRRREFHLYARLAVTFLADHPIVTANIVANRLLPYVKTLGWHHIELFVRRLYVEAREQLIRRMGLLDDITGGPASTNGGAAATQEEVHPSPSDLWLRIFRTESAYALYRECILVFISSGAEKTQDMMAPLVSFAEENTADDVPQQHPSGPSPSTERASSPSPSGNVYAAAGIISEEDADEAFDTRLFSYRSKTQWWQELLRVDALMMTVFYANEPPEYPLAHFNSPLMVQLDKQCPPSAVSTNFKAESFPNSLGGPLKADVEDVVRLSFTVACVVNPLRGPDGELGLCVTSPHTHKPTSLQAVRLQLTLESRKDWTDEEEPTHVVYIHKCEKAAYDEATRQLRAVFQFPVCHAGVYRVRRIRLCNGKTWLAHYPQYSSHVPGSKGRRGLYHHSGGDGVFASHESAPVPLMRAAMDASFRPLTCAPILRVPEPHSSSHLKLTLPAEAHCFADSVDYATLDVDLEDPIVIAVPSIKADGGPPLTSSFGKSVDKRAGERGTVPTGEDSSTDEGAECSCFYEASPGNFLLPLSVAAASSSTEGRHAQRRGTSIGEDVVEVGLQQQMASISPGYRVLPDNDGSGGAEENVSGLSDGSHARDDPPLVAAVVLGTPSIYRQKRMPSSTGTAAASTWGYPETFLSHLAASCSPEGGAAAAGTGFMALSSPLPHGRHSTPQHNHHAHHRHSSQRATPADAHPLNSSSHLLSPSPLAAAAAADPSWAKGGNSNDLRYKSLFKPLRISAAATNATAIGAPQVDAAQLPGSNNTMNASASHRRRSRSAHHYAHLQQHHHLPASLASSEPSVHEGMSAEDGFGRKIGQSFSGATASLVRMGATNNISTAATSAKSPLHEIDPGTFQLVLKHPVNTAIQTTAQTSSMNGSSAVATSVVCTSIPIHLGTYLNSIPTPETETQVVDTFAPSDVQQVAVSATALSPLLQAVGNNTTSSTDHLRENIIRLLPSDNVLHASGSCVNVSPAANADAASGTSAVARIPITRMRLRVPLLPLLVTPASSAQTKSTEAVESTSNATNNTTAASSSSSAEAARQARITFTCLRGREPSSTSLSVVVPFQPAVGFDYAFKHFQGRVYCLVRMKNLLKTTSLWMRGAVLTVLDPEPSYEIVRVCDVYEQLLMTEWKPQDELSILYELDLIASFHPVQPECAHQVQMKVFYSSWENSFLVTPAEDRFVLRPEKLPPTEATAESVELIHEEENSIPAAPTSGTAVLLKDDQDSGKGSDLRSTKPPIAANMLGGHDGSTTAASALRDHSTVSVTHSVTEGARPDPSDLFSDMEEDSRSVQNDSGTSHSGSIAMSAAVHFNLLTLRHLEETCNTVAGPVATFHSKHLCVFNIVMYAESPWTMRFGAATNYVARAPTTPLSGTPSTVDRGEGSLLNRFPAQPPRAAHTHLNSSTFARANANSFFGNAMVDQPSDFVFIAGEPVRFCVRLQPLAQNWPEDANMTETFFIRLKYNPTEWMVIGKQRDRRTLSLMEEVTVYFNAVPLLPRAPTDMERDENAEEAATQFLGESSTDGAKVTAQSSRALAGHAVRDEGILQTPTVEMFWERRRSTAAVGATAADGEVSAARSSGSTEARNSPAAAAASSSTHEDAVMGEAVLIDVVQFRTWVRVRKHGH